MQDEPPSNTYDKQSCLRMMNNINSAQPADGLCDVVQWMTAGLPVFTGQAAPDASSLTIEVISDLITIAMAVLHKEHSQDRLKVLLHPEKPGFLRALVKYIVARIAHAPSIVGKDEQQNAITGLRVLILRSLAKIIALTSFDHLPQDGRILNNCGNMVIDEFVSMHLDNVLIQISGGAAHVHEEIKVASAECLFVFTLRNNNGRAAVAENPEGMLKLLDIVVQEPSPMVRNYIAACIRELTNTHPRQVEEAGLPSLAAKIIGTDNSADVRVLVIESLEVLYKTNPSARIHPGLGEVIVNLLSKGETSEVSDAACRIIDTLVAVESEMVAAALAATPQLPLSQLPCRFTLRFVDCQGGEALVNTIVTQTSLRAVALASRALRRLVQHAYWKIGVGRRIVTSSLAEILGVVKEGEACANANDLIAVSLVELAIGVSLMFAQSSETRSFAQHRLSEHPQWMAAARTALMNLLDKAAPEYFTDLIVADAMSGQRLNVLDGVEWDEQGWPTMESVQRSLNGTQTIGIMPLSLQYSMPDVQDLKMCRFTQVLLRYTAHLALSDHPARSASLPSSESQSPEQKHMPRLNSISVPPPPPWNGRNVAADVITPRRGQAPPPRPVSAPAAAHVPPYLSYSHPTHAVAPKKKVPLGFTNPRSQSRSRSRSRSRSQSSPPAEDIPPEKFAAHDASLKLAIKYSRHFSSVIGRQKNEAKAIPRWHPVSTNTNPWKQPSKKQSSLRKAWTVEDLRAGDLFMFAIPYERLSVQAIENVLHGTKKHQDELKKAFLVTPHRDKGRRWCLFDMLNMVVPHVQDVLIKLARLVIAIGEKDAHVPIFMLREKDISRGEDTVHPGNICEITDQLTYYCTVHQRQADDVADIVSKMQTLAREDPEAYGDISSSSSSSD
eukprot:TRINITY_DN7739_c0_g2_i1.p1 TRINITY_DN7739_c0_g2~~TRINITY_DN7739_c0_g2_i1.p1  ORF type:complete len:896 (+),score=193.92 TRINITY_DN7739_c0_g2_i1:70-2757(+)